jgi:L-fuculose-phosphate aldolase
MKVFAHQDAAAFAKTGAKEFRHNREVLVTPGARDVFSDAGIKIVFESGAAVESSALSAVTSSDDAALFSSPLAEKLKKEICEMGRRVWIREYCDGNGGNISARLAENRFICTPTGVSKGFMTPDMLCMVDGEGRQVAGTWKRSSEITTHLAIYNTTPEAMSVCHAHPCHAGAFAIKGMQPPPRLIPELEVFVGTVAFAEYKTPGSAEMAESIKPLAPQHQSIIMGNHGVITWGKSVEDAYFKMEITDAYCRTVILAQSIPGGASIPCEKIGELLELKKGMGLPDPRHGLKPAELCEVDPWTQMCGQRGCSTPVTPFTPLEGPSSAPAPAEMEALVQKITDEILANLK